MRTLLLDADIPEPVVSALVNLRLPVISIRSFPNAVRDDIKVIEVAHNLDAILVALDKDYTTYQPLIAAMVERGARVVRLRLPKCRPDETIEVLAGLILNNYRIWQDQLDPAPGIVSCNVRGNRLKRLEDLPWYRT